MINVPAFPFLRRLTGPRFQRTAIFAWVLYASVLAIVVAIQPDRRTVTPNYRQAAEKWWRAEESIYTAKKKGFLYLPHAAILYSPFEILPKRAGEPLWRIVSLGALALGIWRASRLLAGGDPRRNPFPLVTALTIPASFASAGNGQVNVILAGLFLHTAVDLARFRYWKSALWLCLSVAFKPIAMVYYLLAGALNRKLWIPLAVMTLLFAAIPFLHPDPAYVVGQFQQGARVLQSASQPGFHEFCDIAGMFRTFGLPMPDAAWLPVRAVAAFVFLGFGWIAVRRHDPATASLFVLAAAAAYLMLFNPRTEANSYILLAPAAALLAARGVLAGKSRALVYALVAFCIALGVDSYGPLHGITNLWLKALATCAFTVYLFREILKQPAGADVTAGIPSSDVR